MRISIVGTGYVGLVTGVCFAERGHEVCCVDVDADKVARINQGHPPIFEEGLEPLLQSNLGRRFQATTDLSAAVLDSELTMIAVGTPFDGQRIDLTFIRRAAEQIGDVLARKPAYHVVVVKSTVVPGTTRSVVMPLLAERSGKRPGADFGVGMNPEFLSEGVAVQDFMNPDRIVLGSSDARAGETMQELYASFRDVEKLTTNLDTAEMIKYASNSVLATLISFANEIGNLCARLGHIDVEDVMRGVHLANYFSPHAAAAGRVTAPITSFLAAGCGFGGSCLPKDVLALIRHGQAAGEPMPLLSAVIDINLSQPERMLAMLREELPTLSNRRVAVLGLAFKPGTDDVRQSPAIPLLEKLSAAGCRTTAYDPVVNGAQAGHFPPHTEFAPSLEAAVADAEAVMIVTRWEEFRELPRIIAQRSVAPVVIDGRRMLPANSVARYRGIGC